MNVVSVNMQCYTNENKFLFDADLLCVNCFQYIFIYKSIILFWIIIFMYSNLHKILDTIWQKMRLNGFYWNCINFKNIDSV